MTNHLELEFSDPLDPVAAAQVGNYAIKSSSLKRTADYGSKHFGEQTLTVTKAVLASDHKTITLTIPELRPTWCMEIKTTLRGFDQTEFSRTIHNTVHLLGPE